MTTTKKKRTTTKASTKLPPNPLSFEVLNLVSKARSKAKKVELLKEYEHPSLKALFIWNFDESVISLLPPGEVPYFGDDQDSLSTKIETAVEKMGESGSIGATDVKHTTIRTEYTKFYNFIKGGNDALSSLRRESIFIDLLQGLHPLEAEILCLCKDKKLQEKYKLTKEIASEAYPDIRWGGRS